MRTDTSVRRAMLAASLDVAGRDVLLVGGGTVAARRAATLLDAGARVRVVAPEVSEALGALVAAGRVAWAQRPFTAADCVGARLVVVATGDPAVDADAGRAAREAGALLNDATDPGRGDVHLTATVRRGALAVAVSSGGSSPALTAYVRRLLDAQLGPELGRLALLAERLRAAQVAAGLGAAERERQAADLLPRIHGLLKEGRGDEAERLAVGQNPGSTPWS